MVFMTTLLISLLGGFLFQLISIPLPWMLGPLMAIIIWRLIFGQKVCWPVGLRNAGLVILGYMMGASFTIKTAGQILEQLPFMMFATLSTVLFSILIAYITSNGTGISLSSSILGSIPGGLSQMVVLGEEVDGADVTTITFMQTIRLLSVVFLVPFFVMHGFSNNSSLTTQSLEIQSNGFVAYTMESIILFFVVTIFSVWITLHLKFPTPFLLGPILGVSLLVLSGLEAPKIPPAIITLAQICIGTYIGLNIKVTSFKNWKRILPYTFGGCLALVGFSFLVGFILTFVHDQKMVNAFLSTAPGGMAEMGITALLVNADLSLITAYQMFRFFFIMFLVPPLIKWWFSRKCS
ncbi:AbrB family transcriptional regulator [Desulfotomaculum sp. 1211_IL3151]|uniref:AbrB family transcriptional regulator n=1 Tax=Desulfotomaculum sp. 1211_IL3151 TaxID=3084055 RepID=UPI002FD9A2F8